MGYKILIADDEPEIRDLLRLYLENEQYEVMEAEDGQQALDLLRSRKPDLCVLDIMMPKMDGYHVLQELRKESNIPVLILSAKNADSEKILGLNLGADDYLSKPFNPLEAVARVNSNIRRFYALGTQDVARGEITVRDLTLDPESCTLGIPDHGAFHAASGQGIYEAADLRAGLGGDLYCCRQQYYGLYQQASREAG